MHDTSDLVPDRPPPEDADLRACAALIRGRRLVVLTGAGCSTESGIPDYRGPITGQRKRNPVQYQQFIGSERWRKRYWSRAMVGWARMRRTSPNQAHRALAALQDSPGWGGLITQNVDGLHQQAGQRDVIELHGALDRVICLACRRLSSRDAFQARLKVLNPGWGGRPAEFAPDGDAEVDGDLGDFVLPACPLCDEGPIKPDVVFFGENVPRERVNRAYAMVDAAEVLLVVGSSLTVFSGFRFPKRMAAQSKPVIILNCGPTRADALATLRIDQVAGHFLTELASRLTRP